MRAGLGVMIFFLLAARAPAGESLRVSPKAAEILQGEVLLVTVSGGDWSEVSGLLGQQRVPFFPRADGGYAGYVAADLEQKPGRLRLKIAGVAQSGAPARGAVELRVKEKRFAEERFSVAPSFDRLDEATLKRIEEEQKRLDLVWKGVSPTRLWSGAFALPVRGELGSPFGLRRIINGLPRSPHAGVDLKAPAGTEVIAANDGRVVVRDEFFFGGKTLVLDHGGGLYSMYLHLSEFEAAEGASVRKGEVIGRVGMTGRATGPHLHWGIRLLGARVDPLALIKASASEAGPAAR
ncbi:MAG TPA: M23 family metallopeptidase [Candidatus Acidoferrales bacterium]|nr:M23 family metallopeptidase [Candidatus Acidoferrales bacterium]